MVSKKHQIDRAEEIPALAIALINQSLDEVLAEQEGEFDADTRWALAWFDQNGFNEGAYGQAETLSTAKNTSVSGMVEAGSQMVSQYAATLLRQDLDKIPLWRGNHVAVKQVVEDYGRYLYLQRLREPEVILTAIRDGLTLTTWSMDSFAFAEGWDEAKQRYTGLQAGRVVSVTADSTGLLVKPDIGSKQLAAEQPPAKPDPATAGGDNPKPGTVGGTTGGGDTGAKPTPPQKPTRFYGTVKIDAARMNRDAATISNEVVRHLLSELGSEVEVTIEVQAKIPQGVPDNVVRTVTENCRTLKLNSHGFEKD